MAALSDSIREGLRGFSAAVSFESQVALTLVIVVAGVALAGVAAPSAVRGTGEYLRDRLGSEHHPLGGILGIFLPARVMLRILQTGILFSMSLLLLVVWGFHDLAQTVAFALANAMPLVVKFGGTLALLVGLVVTIDFIDERVLSAAEEADRVGEHEESVMLRLVHLIILLTVGLATLSLWQFDLGSLLIGAGFLGVILGMASRQILASILSGFVLMFSRPFEVGDWVEIGDIEGTVTDITIMHTHVRSFHGETITLPNDKVEASTVVNRTDRGRLLLQLDIGVDYDSDLDRAKEIAVEAAESVDEVLDVPGPEVVGVEFAESSVVLRLRFWIENPSERRRWQTRSKVLDEVKTAFDEAGINIPFPQRVYQDRDDPATRPEAH